MHQFDDPRPRFLELIDSDPTLAMELFWKSAQQQLRTCPPSVMKSVPLDDRADVIQDVIVHCIKDNFRVLRMYTDEGKPFAAWFMQTARRIVLHWLRDSGKISGHSTGVGGRVESGLEQADPSGSISPEHRRAVGIVNGCILTLHEYCQLLLRLAGEEYKPREIALLLGPDDSDPIKVSEALRQCRKKLVKLLTEKGIALPFDIHDKAG